MSGPIYIVEELENFKSLFTARYTSSSFWNVYLIPSSLYVLSEESFWCQIRKPAFLCLNKNSKKIVIKNRGHRICLGSFFSMMNDKEKRLFVSELNRHPGLLERFVI